MNTSLDRIQSLKCTVNHALLQFSYRPNASSVILMKVVDWCQKTGCVSELIFACPSFSSLYLALEGEFSFISINLGLFSHFFSLSTLRAVWVQYVRWSVNTAFVQRTWPSWKKKTGLVFTSKEMHHGRCQVRKHGNKIASICHITYCDAVERAVLVICYSI